MSAMPNGRCRLHGGSTPAGIASPHFRTGRYSKYLPAHIAEDFNAARHDPELVECRDEIALLDSRLAQLAQRFQTGRDAQLWSLLGIQFSDLASSFDSLMSHVQVTNDDGKLAQKDASRSLESCRATINEVLESEGTWREVYAVIERRRKLVETEAKRLKDLQQVITAEKAMILITSLAAIVRKHVTDPAAINAISTDLIQLSVGNAG